MKSSMIIFGRVQLFVALILFSSSSGFAQVGQVNLNDNAEFFVRRHYLGFLHRCEPDPAGLAFWTNEITSCGSDPQCIEIKRINVSAAFFLSIEFQETSYLVYRIYKSAYGERPGDGCATDASRIPA